MRSARWISVVCCTVLVFAAAAAFAQDSAYEVEGWKKRFASPSYGVAFAPVTIEFTDGGEDSEETLVVPGVDIRIFNGINVAKRGGFYVGHEVGTSLFFLGESDSYSTDLGPYTVEDVFCGTIFLMSKYGYRLDLGSRALGFSAGAELGIGAQMGGGDVTLVPENDPDNDVSPDTEGMPFGPALEASIEGAFRLGQNFRLFLKAGGLVGPALLDWDHEALSGEMQPVRPSIRAGFALNY